ncbi:MAG: hypothetical protein RIR68_1306 [Pseudomonadota bacterium]|jgi:hypothetical protein
MTRLWLSLFVVWGLSLSGCASHTRSMADSISPQDPQYQAAACQRSFELAPLHDDIKLTRSIATPSLLLLTGGGYLLPLLGINIGLDALDQLDASHVSKACGGLGTPAKNILERVVLGAGFSFFTGNVKLGSN